MAQKVEVKFLSDLTPDVEAQETINFSLDGTQYEIDLTSKEAAALRKSLSKYVEAGRKITGRTKQQRGRSSTNGGPSPKEVREWARSNGYTVTDRGRIPQEVMESYQAAH